MADRIGPLDQRINGKIGEKIGDAAATRKASSSDTPKNSKDVNSSSPGDTVELTSGAKLLERVEKSLAELPAMDPVRVAEVKQAIENGEYQVNVDKIAEAMLRLDRELGD